MAITLAFDVYGTLFNTDSITVALEKHVGNKANEFSRTWRQKQLEYSFRRGLMQSYQNFSICISNALDYTTAHFNLQLCQNDKEALIGAYQLLPTFYDVESGLALAKKAGFRMFAFSNGITDDVEKMLKNADIRDYFIGVISVDEVKSYKPSPIVYSHFMSRAGVLANNAWLVSSNPFDVIGAISSGMRAAWIKRSPDALFDPWGIEPTLTIDSLSNLSERITQYYS